MSGCLARLVNPFIRILNQAIAIAQLGDTHTALKQLNSLQGSSELKDYLLLDCAFARVHELDGNHQDAIDSYLAALSKTAAPHEKELLDRKLRKLADSQ